MRLFIAVSLAAFVIGASGCASTSGSSYAANASPKSGSVNQKDYVYMNRVERIAASRGVDVEWVNPPYVDRKRSNVRRFKQEDDG